jgi:hypothetical protein
MAKKRLIVCSDGTWNTLDEVRDGKLCPTNVTEIARVRTAHDATAPHQSALDGHYMSDSPQSENARRGGSVQDAQRRFSRRQDAR